MKTHKCKTLLILFVLCPLLSFYSCKKDQHDDTNSPNLSEIQLSPAEQEKVALYKEISTILGEISKNEENRMGIASMVKNFGGQFESINFSAMMGNVQALSPEGSMGIQTANSGANFEDLSRKLREALLNQLQQENRYATLKRCIHYYEITSKKSVNVDEFVQRLSNADAEVHIPYIESFDLKNNQELTVSYDPIVRTDWSEGRKYTATGSVYLPKVDDKYSQENLTLVVIPVDTTIGDNKTHSQMIRQMNATLDKKFIIEGPVSIIEKGLLKTNVSPSYFTDQDIIYTVIPRIRVRGTAWTAFTTNKLKLEVWRASGELNFDAQGNLAANAGTFKLGVYPFSKTQLKNNEWVDVNICWDDDWNMHEATQQIVLFS
ncbi:MAG: hypothetical protein RR328_07280, partial [Bacteroidales bacterium]